MFSPRGPRRRGVAGCTMAVWPLVLAVLGDRPGWWGLRGNRGAWVRTDQVRLTQGGDCPRCAADLVALALGATFLPYCPWALAPRASHGGVTGRSSHWGLLCFLGNRGKEQQNRQDREACWEADALAVVTLRVLHGPETLPSGLRDGECVSASLLV